MKPALKVYIGLLASGAAYLLLKSGLSVRPDAWLPLALLAVVASVVEILPMDLPNGTQFTLGSAVYFVAFLGYGSTVALWVVTIAVVAYAIVRREELPRAIFNGSNYILSLSSASEVYSLMAGVALVGPAWEIAKLAAFVVTDFFVNTGLLSVVFWQTSHQPVHRVWLTLGLDAYLGHFAIMTIGVLAATMLEHGLVPLIGLFFVLFFLQRLFASYFRTAEQEANRKLKDYEGSIRTLVAAVDARDEHTHGHSERVSEYAVRIGQRLRLSRQDLHDLHHGGLLHDIGKIGVDDRILRKSGALTPEERAVMMEHPVKGAAILSQTGAFSSIVPIVLYHHEWYGSGGYPTGRKGGNIPFLARIISVADAFDAMTSHRHYRPGMPVEDALRRLVAGKGTQFDPGAVDAFVDGIRSREIPVLRHPGNAPARVIDLKATGRILPVHRQELQISYRIALETRLSLSLEHLLPRVLDILQEALGPEQYYIVLVKNGEQPRVAAETGRGGDTLVKRGDIADRVICSGEPVTWAPLTGTAGTLRPRYATTGSAIGVALEVSGEVAGAICSESTMAGRYDDESIYLLKAAAGQIASAIETARYHDQARESALRDGLTGVYNHTYFFDAGERILAEAQRTGESAGIVVADVNHLKQVNKRHGHRAGNQALQHYAGGLGSHARPQDILARCGDDEFMVILPGLAAAESAEWIERAAGQIPATMVWDGAEISLDGLSWGTAAYPESGARLADLVDTAAHAMRAQKRSKRMTRLRAAGE